MGSYKNYRQENGVTWRWDSKIKTGKHRTLSIVGARDKQIAFQSIQYEMPSNLSQLQDLVRYNFILLNPAHHDHNIYCSKIDNEGFLCIRNCSENSLKTGGRLLAVSKVGLS